MAIPASRIVRVNPRIMQAGSNDLELNGLLFTDSAVQPLTSIAMVFASASSVAKYFGYGSKEYLLALRYFTGYNLSFSKPHGFVIARRIKEEQAAWVRGYELKATLQDLRGITDGEMDIAVDGVTCNLTGLDFSGATSLSEVGDVIATAIEPSVSGTTVTYSALTKAFTVTSPTKGTNSTITFATAPTAPNGTDVAALLHLREEDGAVLSQGCEPLSVFENIEAVRQITNNWVSFTTMYHADIDEMKEFAQWSDAQGVDYLYLPWSNDARLTIRGIDTDPASVLEATGTGTTAFIYKDVDYAVFLMGCIASVAWERENSVVTFAFKSQDGLTPNCESEDEAEVLEAKKVNYYGNFATRNDMFKFLNRGVMFGPYKFIDAYINAVWFKNAVQVALMSGLTRTGRVPYNAEGFARIRVWMTNPINRALNNGVIDEGIAITEAQKAELAAEAGGDDISQEINTNGYVLRIDMTDLTIRNTRTSPEIRLWYAYGGSVQQLEVVSTALLYS